MKDFEVRGKNSSWPNCTLAINSHKRAQAGMKIPQLF